jgi:hypothetical protein
MSVFTFTNPKVEASQKFEQQVQPCSGVYSLTSHISRHGKHDGYIARMELGHPYTAFANVEPRG